MWHNDVVLRVTLASKSDLFSLYFECHSIKELSLGEKRLQIKTLEYLPPEVKGVDWLSRSVSPATAGFMRASIMTWP